MERICQDVTNVTKRHWRSVAVQAVPEPENCHGAGFKLRAGERVRVQVSAEFVLGAGVKAKTMTNNLPILSVLAAGFHLKTFLVIGKLSSSSSSDEKCLFFIPEIILLIFPRQRSVL